MEPAIELTCLPGYHFSSKSARPSDHEISDLQALIEDSEQEFPENELPGRYWTSIWLRKPTLLALIALFTALVASLVVLLVVEQDDDGIRSTLSSNHYVWTYGPTAVLVIVLSLWRQVDYYCKLMQPWQEMSKSPKDADNSLLLDYISPPLLTSWVQAVQRRHIPVAASVAGFAIMKLIILFSTGLLVLTPTTVTGLQNITLTTAFAADAFWNTVHSNGTIRADSAYARTYIGVSAEPVYAYVKLLIDQSHEPYSSVLANTMVFQSFEPEETTELLSIITEVDAFVPNISCEIAQTTFRQLSDDDDDDDDNNDEDDPDSDSDSDADPDSDDDDLAVRQLSDANFADFQSPDRNLAVRLNSTTCSVGAENQTQLALQGNPVYCPNDTCPSSFIQYYFWRVNCSDVGDSYSYTTVDIDTPYDFRFALLVSNFTTQTLSSDQGNGIQQNVTPGGTAAVICKVDYSVDRATILQDMADGSVRVQHLTASRQLNNFTSIMLGELIHDALWASQDLDMRDHIGYRQDLKTTAQVTVPLYYVLLRSLIGEQSMNQFLSAETLHSSASQVWAGIVSQFVQESLVMAKNARSTANATFVEPRLHVGLVSLWAMVAGFVLLIVLTICIMFTTRNNVVPQDPGYLATSSSLMITSPSMTGLLNVCGNLRTTQLANLLSVFEFKTKCDHGFRIKATTKRHRILKRTSEEKQYHKATAWVPLAAQYLMIGLTLAVPMVAIVVLEILYSISYRSHGLLDVYDKEQMATYLSRYLSSSIVLSIATMFNSLDFTIASFAPYSLLRSGAVPASRSLYFNLLGKLGPVALWNSIEAHHASSAFSNSAGTIGSALTIVSSGLWVINRTVVMEIATTASLADTWDVSWYNSSGSGDGGASFSFDTFQHGGTALPPSSWHDIVFPNITDIRLSSAAYVPGDSRTQNITIQLQGLRPYLDCQVIADENLDIDFSDVEHDQITISAQPHFHSGVSMQERTGRARTIIFQGPSL